VLLTVNAFSVIRGINLCASEEQVRTIAVSSFTARLLVRTGRNKLVANATAVINGLANESGHPTNAPRLRRRHKNALISIKSNDVGCRVAKQID